MSFDKRLTSTQIVTQSVLASNTYRISPFICKIHIVVCKTKIGHVRNATPAVFYTETTVILTAKRRAMISSNSTEKAKRVPRDLTPRRFITDSARPTRSDAPEQVVLDDLMCRRSWLIPSSTRQLRRTRREASPVKPARRK